MGAPLAKPITNTRDLLAWPFAFAQLDVLSVDDLVRQAKQRGVSLDPTRLEALHRLGLLVPLLRVRRENRLIRTLARRGDYQGELLAAQSTAMRWSLEIAHSEGRVYDPAHERVLSLAARSATAGDRKYLTSEYLYSQFQLMILPVVHQGLPYLRAIESGRPRLDVDQFWRGSAMHDAQLVRRLATVLTVLEPLYYWRIVGSLRLPSVDQFDRFDRWRANVPLTAPLKCLGVKSDWFRQTASWLLRRAKHIDPLGDWVEVIREAHPERWNRLSGLARSALDMRIGAEMLLRYYEDLARGRRAKPLEDGIGTSRGEFYGRLRATQNKERVLSDFGLSPHPSLILVVEGATERLLFPRLMRHFDVSLSREFIAIEDAEGVDTDIGPLVAYAVVPHVDPSDQRPKQGQKYVRLNRPLTRVLFVSDPERKMGTAAQREQRRKIWVERIARALPAELDTPAIRKSLDRLVYVDTWSESGLSFEFAHFGDRQIATAMHQVDTDPRAPSLERRVDLVRNCRRRRGNLDQLFHGSKVDLADQLWPVLQEKVERAEAANRAHRVPIVRVLDRALDLATELRGVNVVLVV